MIALSNAAKARVAEGIGFYIQQITMTLKNGTVFYITNEDILGDSGIEIEDATSSSGKLDVGAAIINSCRFTLMNFDDKFTGHEFYGASLIVKVGIELDGSIEYLDKGRFTVTDAVYSDASVSITAYDNMTKFDRNYSDSHLVYPTTIGSIVNDACTVCGVVNATQTFTNSNLVILTRPDDNALTFREVLSWCAQIAGCFARINRSGQLELKWYDVANIGNDSASQATVYHNVTGVFSQKTGTDDTVITGLRATVKSDVNGENDITYHYGVSGYEIEFSGNAFITKDNAMSILQTVGNKIVGMRFRKMEITHLSDPSFEAGDLVRIPSGRGYDDGLAVNSKQLMVNNKELLVSKRGLYFWGIVSYTKFTAGSSQTTRSDSEEVAINSAARYSEITKAVLAGRESLSREITAREEAVRQLAERIATSSGLYITEDVQPDQSVIYYAHNKPTLAESDIVWKFTAEAFAISTDGGETYPYGLDVSGTAILSRIYTIGLDADYITTGSLIGRDSGGNTVFSFNAETGQIWIKSSQIDVSASQSLDDALSAIDTKAGNAQTEAANATTAAGNAQTTATNAATVAGNAVTTANEASQTADDALAAAQAAETNAKALVVTLSRDSFVIPTDDDGDGGDYTGCSTVVGVQWGNTDVTADADITITDGTGILLVNGKQLIVNAKPLKVCAGDITSSWDPDTHTYTVTESRADIAIVTFTVTYAGKTITKQLNIVKAMQGMQGVPGQDGQDGAAGVSVISVDVWYAISTSSTIAPTTGWSTDQPQWEDGKYIWFKTITAYSTGTTSESEPACITGSAGYPGETGVGIDSIEEQYYLNTSDTETPDPDSPGWSTTPTWESGKFLWSRLKITYDDEQATVKYTDPVLAQAINDANQRAENVQTELNNMELGGVNLIRVANTLLFDNYYFYANLLVNGTQLATYNGGTRKNLWSRIAP